MRYHVPTKIIFSSGAISQIKELVEDVLQKKHPFLVTDQGIKDSGIAEMLMSHLGEIPFFDEIEPNPRHTTIDKAGQIVRDQKPDLIIGLGGGSPLDAAKAIALLAANKGNIEGFEGREKYNLPPLPVIAIPTTCGTGSEVTWVSVITHTERKFKMSIKGPHMYPEVALVDPDLLLTLPPSLIASTGLDALTHAIEGYTVKPASFITDIFARQALFLLFRSIQPAYENIKENGEAREEIMKGSLMAGLSFGNSDVGAVHCLSEAVGSMFDTPHGIANSVLLPYVMEYNILAALEKYAQIAELAGIEERNSRTAAEKLIQMIKDMSRDLGIPTFREIGIDQDQFPEIAQKAFVNNSNPSNPRDMRAEDYLEVLANAYKE
jgi:alcohol dehydrogenase